MLLIHKAVIVPKHDLHAKIFVFPPFDNGSGDEKLLGSTAITR
jgi:hypothetical protein